MCAFSIQGTSCRGRIVEGAGHFESSKMGLHHSASFIVSMSYDIVRLDERSAVAHVTLSSFCTPLHLCLQKTSYSFM